MNHCSAGIACVLQAGLSSLLVSMGSLGIGLCGTTPAAQEPGHTWLGGLDRSVMLMFVVPARASGDQVHPLHPPHPDGASLSPLALMVLQSAVEGKHGLPDSPHTVLRSSLCLNMPPYPSYPTPSSTLRASLLSQLQMGSGAVCSASSQTTWGVYSLTLLPYTEAQGFGDIAGCHPESSSSCLPC